MKLTAPALLQKSKATPYPFHLVIIYGDDAFTKDALLSQFWAQQQQPPKKAALEDIQNAYPALGDLLQSPDLFQATPHQNHELTASEKALSYLKAYVDAPVAGSVLVVNMPFLPPRSKVRQWAEKAPSVAIVACYAATPQDIQHYLTTAATIHNITLDQGARAALMEAFGETPVLLAGEVEKLALRVGAGGIVNADLVAALCQQEKTFDADQLIQALLEKDHRHVARLLAATPLEGDALIGLMRQMTFTFNRLLTVALNRENGMPLEAAFKAGKPPFPFMQVKALSKGMRTFLSQGILKALHLFLSLELAIKEGDDTAPLKLMRGLVQLAARGS